MTDDIPVWFRCSNKFLGHGSKLRAMALSLWELLQQRSRTELRFSLQHPNDPWIQHTTAAVTLQHYAPELRRTNAFMTIYLDEFRMMLLSGYGSTLCRTSQWLSRTPAWVQLGPSWVPVPPSSVHQWMLAGWRRPGCCSVGWTTTEPLVRMKTVTRECSRAFTFQQKQESK